MPTRTCPVSERLSVGFAGRCPSSSAASIQIQNDIRFKSVNNCLYPIGALKSNAFGRTLSHLILVISAHCRKLAPIHVLSMYKSPPELEFLLETSFLDLNITGKIKYFPLKLLHRRNSTNRLSSINGAKINLKTLTSTLSQCR